MVFCGEKTAPVMANLFKTHPATISRLLVRYSAIALASLPVHNGVWIQVLFETGLSENDRRDTILPDGHR